jgi:hypothetical protein
MGIGDSGLTFGNRELFQRSSFFPDEGKNPSRHRKGVPRLLFSHLLAGARGFGVRAEDVLQIH